MPSQHVIESFKSFDASAAPIIAAAALFIFFMLRVLNPRGAAVPCCSCTKPVQTRSPAQADAGMCNDCWCNLSEGS